MSNITPTASYDDVYLIELTDPVEGGSGGLSNRQAEQLANRDEYLKARLDLGLQRNAQARSNVVLTGIYDSTNGLYTALSAPSSNTLRLTASTSFPFIYSASGGYDENGEVTDVRKVTSNLEVSTAALPNRDFLALVQHSPAGNPELGFCQADLYYAGPWEPTEPTGGATALWFNTATGISYISTGVGWVAWRTVVVGRFSKASGSISYVETFPYRQSFYDEETQIGTIRTFAANTEPRGGWLPCSGVAVSRMRYRTLFNYIGTTYGVGDGLATFNMPDLRGRFVRGHDAGAGVDAGRAFGSTQNDEFKAHNHTFTDFASNVQTQVLADTGGTGGNVSLPNAGTAYATNSAMNNTGGTETRPKNVAMGFYIKW